MRRFLSLLIILFIISALAIMKGHSEHTFVRAPQKGGFFNNDLLPDPPMNNERYLEHMNTVERPLTAAEKKHLTYIAANLYKSDKFVHRSENIQQNILKKIPGNPDLNVDLDLNQFEERQQTSVPQGTASQQYPMGRAPTQVLTGQLTPPKVQLADPNESQQVQLLLQPDLVVRQGQPQGPTRHYSPTSSTGKNHPVLDILSDTQKQINVLKESMDNSRMLLANLSTKLEATDGLTAANINSLISCPVCPLTEPGLLNFTNVSDFHYKSA